MFIPGGNRLLSSSFQRQLLSCRQRLLMLVEVPVMGAGEQAQEKSAGFRPGRPQADRDALPVTYLPGQLEPAAGRGRDNHLPEVSFPQKETPSHQSLLFSQPPRLLSPSFLLPATPQTGGQFGTVVGQGRTSLFWQVFSWPRTDSCPKEPPCLGLESGFF